MSDVIAVEKPVEATQSDDVIRPESRDSRWVWLAVAAAFALRYGWVLLDHKYIFTNPTHYDFGQEMGAVARSIVTGRGFSSPFPELSGPTAWVAPLYPLLIACVFKIFGLYSIASALVMLGLNSAFSALTCWPIFHIARDLTNRRVAIYSMWLWALVPEFMVGAVNWVWDTALTGLVLTTFVLIAIRMSRGTTRKQWIGFGLAWGTAALLNPTVLSVLPFILLYIAWHARSRREPWFRPAVLCFLMVMLVITPWLVRNYRAFGRFVFIRGTFWLEMRTGNSIYGNGLWLGFTHPEINLQERAKYVHMGELSYVDSKRQATMEFLRTHPRFFAELCVRRVLFYWWGYGDADSYTPDVLRAVARRTFSTLSLIGLIFLWRNRRRGSALLTGIFGFCPLVSYIAFPDPRHRSLIEPLLLICAVYALSHVREFSGLFAQETSA